MSEHHKKPLSDHPLWLAVEAGDISAARTLLSEDPTLVSRDFRPAEQQDPHTCGFPLVRAAQLGRAEMVELMLEFGADVDAKSPTEEQRELGAPIMLALEGKHYSVMHLLLDHGASLDAYGWCYPALVELLFEEAKKDGIDNAMARKGYDNYLGPTEPLSIPDGASEIVVLFDRVLRMGAQLSMESLVCQQYYPLIEEMLRECPDSPCSKHDHPPGSVMVTLCQAASWHGYPKVLDMAIRICPDKYTPELALDAIERSLTSHNREGLAADYYQLIESQLQWLQRQDALGEVLEQGTFNPQFILARDYLWPGWYGNPEQPSSPATMIELSELLAHYGFNDLSVVDPESGETALARAQSRATEHPGLSEFAEYLLSKGATG